MTLDRMVCAAAFLGAFLVCGGCSSRTLVFTTYTNIGVDVSAANGTPTRAVFGYKRFEGAVVPVDPTQRTKDSGEAMSVFAAIDMTNGWLDGLSAIQVFATGEAAVEAAKEPAAFGRMLQKFGRVERNTDEEEEEEDEEEEEEEEG